MKYFDTTTIILGIVLLGVIAFAVTTPATSMKLGDAGVPNALTSPTAATVTLTNGTSTKILSASSGRLYAYICSLTTNTVDTFLTVSNATNASGSVIGVPAVASNGIDIPKGSCYEISSKNLLVGQINAFSAASNTLSIISQ